MTPWAIRTIGLIVTIVVVVVPTIGLVVGYRNTTSETLKVLAALNMAVILIVGANILFWAWWWSALN